jgi:hypothetical protein
MAAITTPTTIFLNDKLKSAGRIVKLVELKTVIVARWKGRSCQFGFALVHSVFSTTDGQIGIRN